MAAKYQLITELYRRTGVAVAKNPQAWQGFLSSACRNYKCRFDEQLLIYAQRPDAVAVAKLETWNRQFKRWVNKDSKGIAVFDPKGRRNTLKYYFDVSDTHEGYYGSRPVPIWQMDERYEQAVMERLSDRFGDVESTDLASALMETAKNAVEDNLQDYFSQLKDCTKDSFLEELDDFNIEVIYRRLAANSVAFMLISRCGLDTNEFFDRDDFADIVNFNTPATINAIGVATSDIAEMALREISQSIRNVQMTEKDQNRTFAQRTQAQYDKGRQQPERSEYNEQNHLQQTGGLSYSRPNITDRARASAWQVRFDAQGLSGEAQASDLSQSADIGQAERASARGRADSTPEVGASDEAALSRAGRDRETERESTDAVGRTDEQHPQPSGGSDTDRTDLQVSVAKEDEVRVNLPTVDEQIEMIAEAEDENASAFTISKEDIDSVLQKGSGVADGKYRIYRQFQKGEDRQKNIEFLKNEYGTGGGTHIFPDGFSGHSWHDSKGLAIDRNGTYTNHDLVLKWSQVEKRLRELIKDNRYLNPKEKDHYADYLESVSAPQYEIDTQRKIARQRFIDAHRDLPPADKRDTLALRLSDFIRDLDRYEKDLLSVVERSDLADVTAEQMEQHLSDPSTVQQLIDFLAQVQWKTTSVFSRSNGWKFTEELRELHPLRYLYNEGDVVYIGADKYEIATLTEEKVYLQNAEFPILGQEYSRADFEEKLKENPANDHLKVVVTEKQRTETPSEKKQDGIQFSIGFSEHPAFYDRQLNDRYTDLSFALGNKLLGILDEKQHREREGDKNIGWYHKTDFVIKAVIGGEEFNYEGRFDIGDGEGDLIAHIKNFYDYALSPKGEQLYGDDRESLLRGRDEFIPFLEQHTELTQEDEKLLDEIMVTESDWYRTAEEAEEKPQAYTDKLNGSEAPVIEMEQSTDDLIGREIIIDNRKYLIESIGKISGDVSLRDITFQNNVGFPINRVEKIGYIQKLLEQEKTELPPEEKTEAPATDRHNFRINDDAIGVGGAKEKFRNNMAAINLLHELEIENRLATPEEQEVLSRYVGWGGLSMAFDEHNAAWAEEFKELYASLSPEEYRAAMESTLTAFYTPPVVIKAMYDALDRLGFSQGNILEPSCGTGNFFGLLPESMQNSKLHGVEIDSLTGRIAKQLYPKANIAIEGFEKTNLPDDHFDVVLGNVPFGEIRVNDSRYNAQKFLIHDYFFAKALDKVRAGGVVMFITSKGTMDKASPEVRKYIAQRAELLGAIRLPDNTFKANAGTEVTSDILILQKRDRVMDIEPDWVHLDTDENGVTMNRYFVEHPEMVLGEIKMENTRFGTFKPVCKARKDIPLSELLSNAVQRINGEIPELDNEVDEISDEQELSVPADPNVRNFSFTLVDGRVYFRENDRMQPASVSMTAENRIKGLIQIRDCVRKLIEYQTEDYPEEMIRTEQENLNRLYDVYTAKYGLINSRGNYLAFASDESYFLLCSLEVLDDEGNFKRKADMFTKRTIKPHREITSVETASEALALSIGEKARVDLPYMEQLTGKTQAELVQDLQGVIFKVPNCEPVSYVAADEYLSGNVRNKLTVAELAATNDPELAVNVEALKKVIPKDLSAAEISVRLGATWIPQDDIQRFVMELLTPSSYAAGRLKVRYTPINGDWFIENKSSDMGNVKADSTYGTKRASAYRIIEDTLNLRDTRIFDYVYDEHSNKKAVFNAKETTAAQAKQEVIKQAFQDWIWKDPERRNRLVRYYNDTFNSVRPREYDGSHLQFPGMNPEIELKPHQKNAVARILMGGNTLLAHCVGAGKSFEMMAACMEQKRLGLSNKTIMVVPKPLIGQTASEFLRLYPSANILVATERDFEKSRRKQFVSRIATGDYDCIIMSHSQFEKIPISAERKERMLNEQINEITYAIDDMKERNGERWTVKQMESQKKKLEEQLKSLTDESRKDDLITFEELGVDSIMVDEAHNFKNLATFSKMNNVSGISSSGAKKSTDMQLKCQYLSEINDGRGIVFATGTPISNTMCEMYVMQLYLQKSALEEMGIHHFDSWAANFGEVTTALELTVEGSGFRFKSRFNKFTNLPELMNIFREVADVQTADMLDLDVPALRGGKPIIVESEPDWYVKQVMEEFVVRAERIRGGGVDPSVDNFLKITHEARLLGTDARLIDKDAPNNPDGKLNKVAENVWKEYVKGNADGHIGCQLIFSDIGTPGPDKDFTIYDYLKESLIQYGIPAEEIAFIHDAKTDAQRDALFKEMRTGKKKVLIGSTDKCGTGVNVQTHLVAMHHVDCPWKPSSIEQREGRGIRQGNKNDEVAIYRYVTKQTFDAYNWSLVENKQRFISQVMTSKAVSRSCEDIDEATLSYAEIKAVATGNPLIREKMEVDNDVQRLKLLKASYDNQRYGLQDNFMIKYPKLIKTATEKLANVREDIKARDKELIDNPDFAITIGNATYTERVDGGTVMLEAISKCKTGETTPVGKFHGFELLVEKNFLSINYMVLRGKTEYKAELSTSPVGSMVKLENLFNGLHENVDFLEKKIEQYQNDLEASKAEYDKPFAYSAELEEKLARQYELNAQLDLENAKAMDADLGGPDEEKSEDRIENAGIVAEDKGIYMPDRNRKR